MLLLYITTNFEKKIKITKKNLIKKKNKNDNNKIKNKKKTQKQKKKKEKSLFNYTN